MDNVLLSSNVEGAKLFLFVLPIILAAVVAMVARYPVLGIILSLLFCTITYVPVLMFLHRLSPAFERALDSLSSQDVLIMITGFRAIGFAGIIVSVVQIRVNRLVKKMKDGSLESRKEDLDSDG